MYYLVLTLFQDIKEKSHYPYTTSTVCRTLVPGTVSENRESSNLE
jgi:hypothetical protein